MQPSPKRNSKLMLQGNLEKSSKPSKQLHLPEKRIHTLTWFIFLNNIYYKFVDILMANGKRLTLSELLIKLLQLPICLSYSKPNFPDTERKNLYSLAMESYLPGTWEYEPQVRQSVGVCSSAVIFSPCIKKRCTDVKICPLEQRISYFLFL